MFPVTVQCTLVLHSVHLYWNCLLVRTCYAADPWGGYGMDWFDAMQCCYFQNSYLAEPTSQEEMDKIAMYLTICEFSLKIISNFGHR